MARISTYEQDSTLHVNDKLLGTDSGTAATKNFTIQSIVDLINDEGLIGRPLSVSYDFGTYDEDTAEPRGVVALGTSNPTPGNYSDVTEIVISKQEKGGLNVETFLESLVGYNIRISDRDGNKTNYGVFTVAAVADIDDNNDNFLRMTLTHQNSKGTIALAGKFYITVNPSEPSQADWNATSGKHEILNKPDNFIFETSSVTDLSDVTSAGSGAIITTAERNKLASGVVPTSRTIQVQGTAYEVEVSPSAAQDLSANRTFTIGLPDDVIIGDDLRVTNKVILGGPIEYTGIVSSTPTFDNGIYYSTEDGHDTLHFRYHGHDLSIDHLTENVPTGILNGGELTKANSTQFTIAAGNGVINVLNKSNSDPHPEIKQISWGGQTITVSNLDSNETDQLNSWIYVDNTGTVQQQATPLTDAQKRSNLLIGSAIHSEGVLKFVKTFPLTGYSNISQMTEFIQTFGPMKKSGHVVSANGANLSIDRAAGTAFALGRNYANDPLNPSTVSDNSKTTCVIHRYYGDGSNGFILDDGASGNGYTVLDPSKYDDGSGTLANMSGGHYSVQRLYYFPGTPDIVIAYYGRDEYNSMQEAENNYLKESFIEASNTAEQAIYLGAVILRGNVTELNDTDDAKFLTSGTFRSLAAVNVGGAIASDVLNDLSDVNIQNVANDQVLKYNSTAGQWRNVADSVDPISLDSINGRAGLNVPSPSATLDVKTTETANSAKIFDFKSNGDVSRLYLQNDGDLVVNTGDVLIGGTIKSATPALDKGVYLQTATNNDVIGYNLRVADGSNNRRATLFLDDENGLYGLDTAWSSGAPEFVIRSGGVEDFRIDSSGRVGIGEDDPSRNLHIKDDTSAYIRIEGSNTNNTAIEFADSNSGNVGRIQYDHSADEMTFRVNGNTAITIDDDRNVGIGELNPDEKLHIKDGYIKIEDNAYDEYFLSKTRTDGSQLVGFQSHALGALSIHSNGSEAMHIDRYGNVGIGTGPSITGKFNSYISATRQLTHNGNGGDLSIISDNNSTPVMYIKGTGTADLLQVFDNTNQVFTIDDGGNVGIGHTDPNERLHLHKLTSGQNYIQITNSTTGTASSDGMLVGLSATEKAAIWLFENNDMRFGTNNSEAMRISSSGNVGIGTGEDINAELEVSKDDIVSGGSRIRITNSHNGSDWAIDTILGGIDFYSSDASNQGTVAGIEAIQDVVNATQPKDVSLVFKTRKGNDDSDALEKMRIDSDGNVGIGQDNPVVPLHVNGFARLNGGIQLNGGNRYIRNIDNSKLSLGTNNTDQLDIDADGNVNIPNGKLGVGMSTTPDSKLHIQNASGGSGGYLKVTDIVYNGDVRFGMADGIDNDAHFGTWTNNNVVAFTYGEERLRINSNGNLNVGNSSTGVQFAVHSTDEFRINGVDLTSSAWNSLFLRAGASGGIFIEKDTNNVGILTTSPDADLDVNGTIAFNSLKDTEEDITITKFVDEADTIASNNNDTTIPTSAAVDAHIESKSTTDRNNSYKIMGIAMDYLSRVHDDGGTVEGMEDVMKNTEELILA